MKMTRIVPVVMLFALAAASETAWAENVRARLHGYNEVPAVSSTGAGEFTARVDDDAIEYELSYADLEAAALAAHIHLGQKDVTGGVAAFLCGGGGKPACPAAGTVTGTIVAADVIGPTGQGIAAGELAELVAAIRAGQTYVNVHTTKHPGGEIRGQVREDSSR